MDDISYILQWAALAPSKLPLSMGIWTPSNMFLGPTPVHTPNGTSIGSAVFFRAHDRDRETDRQDHAVPSVTIGRIYV